MRALAACVNDGVPVFSQTLIYRRVLIGIGSAVWFGRLRGRGVVVAVCMLVGRRVGCEVLGETCVSRVSVCPGSPRCLFTGIA
jgi:hypothetical protein